MYSMMIRDCEFGEYIELVERKYIFWDKLNVLENQEVLYLMDVNKEGVIVSFVFVKFKCKDIVLRQESEEDSFCENLSNEIEMEIFNVCFFLCLEEGCIKCY